MELVQVQPCQHYRYGNRVVMQHPSSFCHDPIPIRSERGSEYERRPSPKIGRMQRRWSISDCVPMKPIRKPEIYDDRWSPSTLGKQRKPEAIPSHIATQLRRSIVSHLSSNEISEKSSSAHDCNRYGNKKKSSNLIR